MAMAENSRLARVDGLWVHQGNPDPGANWEGILEEVRLKSDAPAGLKSEDQKKPRNDRAVCYVVKCIQIFFPSKIGSSHSVLGVESRELKQRVDWIFHGRKFSG